MVCVGVVRGGGGVQCFCIVWCYLFERKCFVCFLGNCSRTLRHYKEMKVEEFNGVQLSQRLCFFVWLKHSSLQERNGILSHKRLPIFHPVLSLRWFPTSLGKE